MTREQKADFQLRLGALWLASDENHKIKDDWKKLIELLVEIVEASS